MLATWTKKFRCWRVPVTFCTSLPTRCFLSLNSEKLFSCVLVMDCHCHFIVLYSSLENNKKQKQWNWPKEGRKIVGKFVGIWPPDTKLNLVVLKLRTHVQVEDWLHTYTFPVPLWKKVMKVPYTNYVLTSWSLSEEASTYSFPLKRVCCDCAV